MYLAPPTLVRIFALLVATLACASDEAAEPKTGTTPNIRRHDSGPLTEDDFLAPVPETRPPFASAYTETELKWEYTSYGQTTRVTTVVELRDIQIHAVIRRDRSWNLNKSNRYLLQHEQGHFDLAQLFAMELEKEFLESVRDGKSFRGRGRNENEAKVDLERQLKTLLETRATVLRKRHINYDEVTDHGHVVDAQNRERSEQTRQLESLAKRLKQLREE